MIRNVNKIFMNNNNNIEEKKKANPLYTKSIQESQISKKEKPPFFRNINIHIN